MTIDLNVSSASREKERLRLLNETHLLDSSAEDEYDDLLRLATRICGTHKGSITFVDDRRVFHKSAVGFEASDLPRTASMCDVTVRQSSVLVVEDLERDERFSSKELLLESGIRFYAGVPLATRDGHNLGAICVFGGSPRGLSDVERDHLMIIARQISTIIELRVEKERSARLLKRLDLQQTLFETYFNSIPVESCLKDADGRIVIYNQALAKRFGITSGEWLGKTSEEIWPPSVAAQIVGEEREIWKSGQASTKYIAVPYKGAVIHWRYTRIPCSASNGRLLMLCIAVDVTTEVQQRLDSEREQASLKSTALQLRERLQRDDLTGLHNRTAFEAGCLSALFALKTDGKVFGVLSIDLGALAMFNRQYGTDAVDDLLRKVADALLVEGAGTEVAARVAGGSFRIIVCPADEYTLRAVATRIEKKIGEILWKGKLMSPQVRFQLFRERQMHPGDLYSTPKTLVTGRVRFTEKKKPASVVQEAAVQRESVPLVGVAF